MVLIHYPLTDYNAFRYKYGLSFTTKLYINCKRGDYYCFNYIIIILWKITYTSKYFIIQHTGMQSKLPFF